MPPASNDDANSNEPPVIDDTKAKSDTETDKTKKALPKGGKGKNNKKDNGGIIEKEEDTMSEEDRLLKERLDTCVLTVLGLTLIGEGDKAIRAKDPKVTVPLRLNALKVIVTELRSATSSMTSVPKPLKFLRPHYAGLKELYQSVAATHDDNEWLGLRARLSDVLSVLAMTMGKPGTLHLKARCSEI
jgi:26S proteasome regulatory subunit N1